MKTYEVTIRATITKTYIEVANTEQEAIDQAQESFSVLEDGTDENYDQEILDVEVAK